MQLRWPALLALIVLTLPMTARAGLSAEQWRTDLAQMDTEVRERHLEPFHTLSEPEWQALIDALDADIPNLSDAEIVVRMAAIIVAIGDGHTRLTLPRRQPVLGLRVGHTPTPDPNDPALRFDRLPVSFYAFEEGLYITESTREHADLLGARVMAFEDTPADQAMEMITPVVHRDNDQGLKDMAADRLAIPEVLHAIGITHQSDKATLTVHDRTGEDRQVTLVPIGDGAVTWQRHVAEPPFALSHGAEKFWHAWLNDGEVLYIHLYEVYDDDERMLVAWFAGMLSEAAARGTQRLIIDLRRNYGGDSSNNRGLVMALKDIGDFDTRGNTYVLIGRSTFSAAQNLVNDLEQWTRAIFVGEPTGTRPGSYGDSRKIRLEHSGLTVRVSTRYHADWLGQANRSASLPDVPVPVRAGDWLAGRDAALAMALDHEPLTDLGKWYRELFEAGGFDHATIRLWLYRNDPRHVQEDFSESLAAVASDYLDQGQLDEAYYTALLAKSLFPYSPASYSALGAALEARGDTDAAREAYERAQDLK